MAEAMDTIAVPQTPQELDLAVQQFKTGEFSAPELFRRWQAIREASLAQSAVDLIGDRVPGEDSY